MSEATITVVCEVCGGDLTLERPSSGDKALDRMLMRMAARTVHCACSDKLAERDKAARIASMLGHRAETWGKLCDPFYQNSEEWLASEERKIGVNLWAIEEARKWKYGPRGLLLHGQGSGTGKTTAAWLVLKPEHAVGRFIVALSHAEFTRQATLLARDGGLEQVRWHRTVSNCDILFIDDLGQSKFQSVQGTAKVAEETLFDLLDSRIRMQLPCIFTSNSDGPGLEKKLSPERAEAFMRRIKEHYEAVNFDAA